MQREEALEKIAWYQLKHLTRDEATELILEFFNEPLKPSLRQKLNLTAVLQWETHQPPADLHLNPKRPRHHRAERLGHLFRRGLDATSNGVVYLGRQGDGFVVETALRGGQLGLQSDQARLQAGNIGFKPRPFFLKLVDALDFSRQENAPDRF